MAKNKVLTVGFQVMVDSDNRYRVTCWHRLADGGRLHEAVYDELTWTEAVDVLLAELHGRRPGWEVGEGWSQPPLPFD